MRCIRYVHSLPQINAEVEIKFDLRTIFSIVVAIQKGSFYVVLVAFSDVTSYPVTITGGAVSKASNVLGLRRL